MADTAGLATTCLTAEEPVFRPYPTARLAEAYAEWDGDGENGLDYAADEEIDSKSPDPALDPNDPFLQSCSVNEKGAAGGHAMSTARFLTVTSVERRKASVKTAAAAPQPVVQPPPIEGFKENTLIAGSAPNLPVPGAGKLSPAVDPQPTNRPVAPHPTAENTVPSTAAQAIDPQSILEITAGNASSGSPSDC